MDNNQFIISFENVSVKDANQYAAELAETLRDVSPEIEVNQHRDNKRSQDFGATLILVLGTPAVLALANGIANGLRAIMEKYHGVSIVLTNAAGEKLEVTNLTGKKAGEIIQQYMNASKQ